MIFNFLEFFLCEFQALEFFLSKIFEYVIPDTFGFFPVNSAFRIFL